MSRRDQWNCRNEACLNQCGELDAVEGQLNKALAALGDETRMRMSAERSLAITVDQLNQAGLECERLKVESQYHRDEWNEAAMSERKFVGQRDQARADLAAALDSIRKTVVINRGQSTEALAAGVLAACYLLGKPVCGDLECEHTDCIAVRALTADDDAAGTAPPKDATGATGLRDALGDAAAALHEALCDYRACASDCLAASAALVAVDAAGGTVPTEPRRHLRVTADELRKALGLAPGRISLGLPLGAPDDSGTILRVDVEDAAGGTT